MSLSPPHNKHPDEILVSYEELSDIGIKAMELVGVPTEDANTTVHVLLCADLRGVGSHGIQRLLMYAPRLRKGLINPRPNIRLSSLAPAMRIAHGDNGLGPVVATMGMNEAIDLARDTGIAFVGCTESNHFGAGAPYVLMACSQKMIGIASTNAFPTMAPWGGLEKVVGNNPLALGVPHEGSDPFVLDMAMSVSSRGRMRQMAEKGEKIPEGWAVDSQGNPTTDPLEGLKGSVLPIGLYKGYGLAMAMDILSGVLTGAGFSTGVKSLLQQWEEPQHVGHFLMAIDPTRLMSWEAFSARMKQLCELMGNARRIDPDKPIFVPGEPEAQLERERRVNGIPLQPEVFETLNGLAKGEYDYDIPRF